MNNAFSNKKFYDANENVVAYDGSPVMLRISVYAIVIKNKQILLVKDKHEQRYDIPGGGLEPGENLMEALAREAREEAGVEIKVGKLVHIAEGFFYHSGEKKYYQTMLVFYAAEPTSELTQPKDPKMEPAFYVDLEKLSDYPVNTLVSDAFAQYLNK